VEWGVAAEALRGESQSGDAHVVCAVPNGTVLAVVDGIGHGREAADAARRAAAVIERSAARGAVAIVRLCHEALTSPWIRETLQRIIGATSGREPS
jgi:hypothetical protein